MGAVRNSSTATGDREGRDKRIGTGLWIWDLRHEPSDAFACLSAFGGRAFTFWRVASSSLGSITHEKIDLGAGNAQGSTGSGCSDRPFS